jgi:hypothetical protein
VLIFLLVGGDDVMALALQTASNVWSSETTSPSNRNPQLLTQPVGPGFSAFASLRHSVPLLHKTVFPGASYQHKAKRDYMLSIFHHRFI